MDVLRNEQYEYGQFYIYFMLTDLLKNKTDYLGIKLKKKMIFTCVRIRSLLFVIILSSVTICLDCFIVHLNKAGNNNDYEWNIHIVYIFVDIFGTEYIGIKLKKKWYSLVFVSVRYCLWSISLSWVTNYLSGRFYCPGNNNDWGMKYRYTLYFWLI